MRTRNKRVRTTAVLLAIAVAATALTGCGNKEKSVDTEKQGSQEKDETTVEEIVGGSEENEFSPADLGIPAQKKYEYAYAGLSMVLTETMQKKMENKDVVMLSGEEYNNDNSIKYAALYWYLLTEEQKNEKVTAFDPEAWKETLAKIGVLGVYHKDSISELDRITGCTRHKEIGKSADGAYVYYLSIADGAEEELKNELEKTEVMLTTMQKMEEGMGKTAFSEGRMDTANGDKSNVGKFKTTDVSGKEYTEDIFKEYDLTLVNVFTTWCSPCVEEMPELEKLKKEMEAKGVNVVGLVYDTVMQENKKDEGAIETAKLLQEKAGLTFPLLMPDETYMNGRLKGIDSYPESFFVDKDGNIVGEKYLGTRSFEEWKEIAEKELANLKGTNK